MSSVTSELTSSDISIIEELYLADIPKLYPFSGRNTFEAILRSHITKRDPNGYFTKRKTIWKLIDEEGNLLGFTVATEKRGGCVKFGPTVICPNQRNQKYGQTIRALVERKYAECGFRKAYSTTDVSNIPAIFYLLKIGYRIEIHLRDHYLPGKGELVLSKELALNNHENEPLSGSSLYEGVPSFLASYFNSYFSEIDSEFFHQIQSRLRANPEQSEQAYIDKQKIEFLDIAKNLYALAIPKRGGAVKLCPLVLSDDLEASVRFLKSVVSAFDNRFHKLYALIPTDNTTHCRVLRQNDFQLEGLLQEPYKHNVNMYMYSRISKA